MLLWSTRRQFWQPRYVFVVKWPNFFRSKFNNLLKKFFFQKNRLFLRNVFIDNQKAVVTTRLSFVWEKVEMFSLKVQKWFKKCIFSKEPFLLKECCYGQLEGNFDNAAMFLSSRGRVFFAQSPKIIEKIYFFKKTDCS